MGFGWDLQGSPSSSSTSGQCEKVAVAQNRGTRAKKTSPGSRGPDLAWVDPKPRSAFSLERGRLRPASETRPDDALKGCRRQVQEARKRSQHKQNLRSPHPPEAAVSDEAERLVLPPTFRAAGPSLKGMAPPHRGGPPPDPANPRQVMQVAPPCRKGSSQDPANPRQVMPVAPPPQGTSPCTCFPAAGSPGAGSLSRGEERPRHNVH